MSSLSSSEDKKRIDFTINTPLIAEFNKKIIELENELILKTLAEEYELKKDQWVFIRRGFLCLLKKKAKHEYGLYFFDKAKQEMRKLPAYYDAINSYFHVCMFNNKTKFKIVFFNFVDSKDAKVVLEFIQTVIEDVFNCKRNLNRRPSALLSLMTNKELNSILGPKEIYSDSDSDSDEHSEEKTQLLSSKQSSLIEKTNQSKKSTKNEETELAAIPLESIKKSEASLIAPRSQGKALTNYLNCLKNNEKANYCPRASPQNSATEEKIRNLSKDNKESTGMQKQHKI